ncbi:MAG: hypothetical protein V4633_13350 [Pseudomonadota bacterium]
MIDLTKIDDDTLMARGAYSTIRAAHEDEKKSLQMLCGELSSTATKILRVMQPDADAVPESVDALLASGRLTLDSIERCTDQIIGLAQQKHDLKTQAWGKR